MIYAIQVTALLYAEGAWEKCVCGILTLYHFQLSYRSEVANKKINGMHAPDI